MNQEYLQNALLCYDPQKPDRDRFSVYPLGKTFQVNELTKRCDILVYDWEMKPFLIVECKSPNVPVSDATFRQIAAYNMPLQVKYLVLTNGLTSWCCAMDYANVSWQFIGAIPFFPEPASK